MLKNKILIAVFALITAASAAGTVVSTATQADYVIKIGFLGSPEDEDYDGSLVFKDFVESRSNGRVAVEIYPSGQFCGNERECIEAMQSGVLEIHMTTIGGLANFFGPGQVFDLPYVFRDDAVAECVFDGPIVGDMRRAILDADIGMRLMTVSNTGGWRNFATTDKQIRTPADLEGLKIRTTPAAIEQEMVRQMGGNPTPVAWSELYTGLATGVVVGTKNGIQDIVGMKFHEHIKYLTLDNHAYMGALWWYSEAAWQDLPDDVKRIVYDGFQQLKLVTRALPIRRQIESYEVFKDSGGQIYVPTPQEKEQFKTATDGMRDWYIDQYGEAWLNRLDTAVASCEASTDRGYNDALN